MVDMKEVDQEHTDQIVAASSEKSRILRLKKEVDQRPVNNGQKGVA